VDRSETKVECSVAGIAHQIRCPVTPTSPRRIFVSMEMHGRPRIYLLRIVRQYRHESERARARAIAYPSSRARFFAPFPEDLYFTSQSRAASRAGVAGANAEKKRAREREREGKKKIYKNLRKQAENRVRPRRAAPVNSSGYVSISRTHARAHAQAASFFFYFDE